MKRSTGGYSVPVTNTGRRAGDEVVQLYVHQRTSRDVRQLKPGETRTVRLRLTERDLAHGDVTRSRWVVEAATYDVLAGSSSADVRARTTWKVTGVTIPPRDLSRTTRAENFDDYAAIRLVDESKVRGTAVGATGDGAWVSYADARLRAAERSGPGWRARRAPWRSGSAPRRGAAPARPPSTARRRSTRTRR
ncbi:fibronectin type III-like domain-contianing protein [Streptomyces sp. VRA16 Mangrove soil]|uniref:fibronectin type III-like domain-contianing protein n=1 Tax=Streptomyces sp. VRA16 Mangrove soil TaxID=2817434 RepID=UPI001E2E734C|nr:fibronectin type III-like domain-contianing protein [Streptomyces sp. VRA16 Mangrove soil]